MFRSSSVLYVLSVLFLSLSSFAQAFPTWIGVYGTTQRHNTQNPGTFTVLINEDSPTLRAEVGIRVNNGSYQTYPMSYSGKADINSRWTYTPPAAYTSGTVVTYYFHGFDGAGAHIYDNAGGANFSFTVAPAPALQWIGNVSHWPPSGQIDPPDDFWVNIESWPAGSASGGIVLFTTNNWARAFEAQLTPDGTQGNNDKWHALLGRFVGNTRMQYAVRVQGKNGSSIWNSAGGTNYPATWNAGRAVQWVGNTRSWPTPANLTSSNSVWIDTESWPVGAAMKAQLEYSVGGGLWYADNLEWSGIIGNNDAWHLNIGALPPGKTLTYRVKVTDGLGATRLDPVTNWIAAAVPGSASDADSDLLPDAWELFWNGNLQQHHRTNTEQDGPQGLPFDNALEWHIGLEPTHSNSATDVALAWQPGLPVQGGVIRFSYATNASTAIQNPIRLEGTFSGGSGGILATNLVFNPQRGRYEVTLSLPASTQLLATVSGVGTNRDNNRGLNWPVRIRLPQAGEVPDTDTDGLPDAWEYTYALDPFDSTGANGANGDPDGDGVSNLDELRNGTDPRSAVRTVRIKATTTTPAQGSLRAEAYASMDMNDEPICRLSFAIGNPGWPLDVTSPLPGLTHWTNRSYWIVYHDANNNNRREMSEAGAHHEAAMIPAGGLAFMDVGLTTSFPLYDDATKDQNKATRWNISVVGAAMIEARANEPTASDGFIPVPGDYNGDRLSDFAEMNSSTFVWNIRLNGSVITNTFTYGYPGCVPVPADYDGDGRTDIAVVHTNSLLWFIQQSTAGYRTFNFGFPGCQSVPADYDGDAKADPAVYHTASNRFYIARTTAGFTNFVYGFPTVRPIVRDYDGDGRADVAVFHPATATWYISRSRDGALQRVYGWNGPKLAPADFDGDLKADLTVYDQPQGAWYINRSRLTDANPLKQWNTTYGFYDADPVPADYDGDGIADIAVRLAGSAWSFFPSTSADYDSDGLPNEYERGTYLTDSLDADTDDDALTDGEEVRFGTDPRKASPDTDGDGLLDDIETYLLGSNPDSVDTDGDSIADGSMDPDGLGMLRAGPDTAIRDLAPESLPSMIADKQYNTIIMVEDAKGRPTLACLAKNAAGSNHVYVARCFEDRPAGTNLWRESYYGWEAFGSSLRDSGVSTNVTGAKDLGMDLLSDGSPVVAWIVHGNALTNPATVALWNPRDQAWRHIAGPGQGNALPSIDKIAVATDKARALVYVAYDSMVGSARDVVVRKWDGKTWQAVGAGIFNRGLDTVRQLRVAVDPSGAVFVGAHYSSGAFTVRKWNGSSWIPVDNISDVVKSGTGTGYDTDMKLSPDGIPYATWSPPGVHGRYLRRFIGGAWSGLGGSDLGWGLALTNVTPTEQGSIAFDQYASPRVAWTEYAPAQASQRRLFIKRWIGTGWAPAGSSMNKLGVNTSGRLIDELAFTWGARAPTIAYAAMRGTTTTVARVSNYLQDSDGDGHSDAFEQSHKNLINNVDTDGDGFQDWWEDFYGFNKSVPDSKTANADGDELTDWEEYLAHTNPKDERPDTDGDGLSDDAERRNGTSPTRTDTDADHVPDNEELTIGTSATGEDSDQDGLIDGWETLNGTDPLDDGSINAYNGPQGDADGDGVRNIAQHDREDEPDRLDRYVRFVPTQSKAIRVRMTIGDPSPSHSESYRMTLGFWSVVSPIGSVISEVNTYDPIYTGKKYSASIQHVRSSQSPPDLDYQAELAPQDADPTVGFIATPGTLLGVHNDVSKTWFSQEETIYPVRIDLLMDVNRDGFAVSTDDAIEETRGAILIAGDPSLEPLMVHLVAHGTLTDGTVTLEQTSGPALAIYSDPRAISPISLPKTWPITEFLTKSKTLYTRASNAGTALLHVRLTHHSASCADSVVMNVIGLDITEVASGQLPGRECQRLPTAFYKDEADNPMLIATRQGRNAHLTVHASVLPSDATAAYVGIRRVGESTILASSNIIPGVTPTRLQYDAYEGREIYEIVGGVDLDGDRQLDNSEATMVFEKTPRTDAHGNPATAGLEYLDKIIVVTESQFQNSKDYIIGLNQLGTDYAGDLIETFGRGSTVVHEAGLVPNQVISTATPGLSHHIGAKWDSNCADTTYRFRFGDGTEASDDVEDSTALSQVVDSVIHANLEALLVAGSADWHESSAITFSESKDFFVTEKPLIGINELGNAFGKVNITGELRIKCRTTSASTLEVSQVNIIGSFDDLYDFAYGGGDRARQASLVQAGHATLSTSTEPSGKLFFTRVEFATGWRTRIGTYTRP